MCNSVINTPRNNHRLGARLFAAAIAACAGAAAHADLPIWQFQKVVGVGANTNVTDVVQTNDGGFLAVGSRPRAGTLAIWVIKLDYAGTVEWERFIDSPVGESGDEHPHRVIQTADGGYAIAADVTSSGDGLESAIIKLGPSGNVLWGRAYFGTMASAGPRGASLFEMFDGSIVAASRYSAEAYGQVLTLFRVSPAGTRIFGWGYRDERLPIPLSTWTAALDVAGFPTPGGPEIVVAGWIGAPGSSEALALRTDPMGNPLHMRRLANGPAGSEAYANGLAVAPSGEVFMTVRGVGGLSCIIHRLDPALVPHASSLVAGHIAADRAAVWRDGSLWTAGVSIPAYMTMVRTDPMGLPNLGIKYGGLFAESARGLAPSADGGWIIGGVTSQFGVTGTRLFLAKTEVDAFSGCNESPFLPTGEPFAGLASDTPWRLIGLQDAPYRPVSIPVVSNFVDLCTFCPCDYNRDGQVDFFDYLDFLVDFNAEDPRADWNRDGSIDFFDYLDFVACEC